MQGFNLYREAKDHYNLLIPEKSDGLIILSLYTKYGESEFSEDQIISVIGEVLVDLSKESSRAEYERNNNIILRLQDYFLLRNESKKKYRLKKYGIDFCKRINTRLIESYTPAKIKRWFDELYNKLQDAIQFEDGFNKWVEDHFDIRQTLLAEQVEILDQQVSESVKEFRSKIKSNNYNIVELFHEIDTGLELIKKQALELKKAFQTTYDIDDILTQILETGNAYSFIENIQKVRNFNDYVRTHLEQISNRIEKIKPRIREFIFDFNQKDFDRKSEKFLYYLLNNSQLNVNPRAINLPENVPLFYVNDKSILPKFIIVPHRPIGPKPPIEIPVRTFDVVKKELMLNKAVEWKKENDRIEYWVNYTMEKVNIDGVLEFESIFFKILKEENFNKSIAIKTAHRVLRKSIKNIQFNVEIIKDKIFDIDFNNVSIWKMRITKK